MPRVDVWDIPDPAKEAPIQLGFRRGVEDKYQWGRKLGEGGFGSVSIVTCKRTGREYACKSISKRLNVPGLAPEKQQQHLENIKREVGVLRKLRGTLNVVHLEDVYEDDTHAHIIMEYCRGGELMHRIGQRHYSEKTVSSQSWPVETA
jgi:calcium-dependent protein kinase